MRNRFTCNRIDPHTGQGSYTASLLAFAGYGLPITSRFQVGGTGSGGAADGGAGGGAAGAGGAGGTGGAAGGAGGAAGGNAGGTGGNGGTGGGNTPDPIAAAEARVKAMEAQLTAATARAAELEKATRDGLTAAEASEYRKLKADQAKAEEDRKLAQGRYEELIRDKDNQYQGELNKYKQQLEAQKAVLRTERRDRMLSQLIPQYTDVPVQHVNAALFDRSVAVDDDGRVSIKDESGVHPLSETTGKPMTLEEFVRHTIGKNPWAAAAKPASGAGTGSQRAGTGGTGTPGQFTAEQLADMSPEEFRQNYAAIQAGLNPHGRAGLVGSGR